ncbi:MAG: TonB-dependent receptor [Candidatus Wallbacteria bacterium]|nr:TonB-dependent receptor [Candidatus Wallbacteria bacterium]
MSRHVWIRAGRVALLAATMTLAIPGAVALFAAGPTLPEDLTQISMEDLLNVRITSVSKVPERLSKAPAAVYVIRQEDIRRSGAGSIPDLLRMVPGLEVARIDANKWAVTARQANSRFANKLLVLMDGRSVYAPLFSGVYWDAQDTVLEDIERIEVIRGPGAALWGANAVSGVINIITKSAHDTKGGLLTAGAGTELKTQDTLRWGGNLGEDADYRVWAKYLDRDASATAAGAEGRDGWQARRGGFRVDWDRSSRDAWTFQGDLYGGGGDTVLIIPTLTPPSAPGVLSTFDMTGTDLQTRWHRKLSDRSDFTLKLYFDRTVRRANITTERRDAYDADLQLRRALNGTHELLAGLEYRMQTDATLDGPAFNLRPRFRDDPLYSAFLQDKVKLDGERLILTLGSRVENNSYSGTQWEPDARLAWSPSASEMFWGSVSRATRTPSRAESDVRWNTGAIRAGALFPGSPPAFLRLTGNPSLGSELLTAYELGYRAFPNERLTLSASVFFDDFHDLIGTRLGAPFREGTHLVVPNLTGNFAAGSTKGVELSSEWTVRQGWRLAGSYTRLELDLPPALGAGTAPSHQFQLRSYLDVSRDVDLDAMAYYVGDLPGLGIPSYVSLDLRLGWRPRSGLELSLIGQNLLDERHPEFAAASLAERLQVERNVQLKATWKF